MLAKTLTFELAEWARAKSGEYDYTDANHCAIAQFEEERGQFTEALCPYSLERKYGREIEAALRTRPWTFAALAERLEFKPPQEAVNQ